MSLEVKPTPPVGSSGRETVPQIYCIDENEIKSS